MRRSQDTPHLLTLPEAALALRLSRTKLYRERRAGRLRTVQFGRSVRVRPEELRRYIREAGEWER